MVYCFEAFELDPQQRELRVGGQRVHVEPQVFDLLVLLVENRDRVIGKDEIFNRIWDGRIVSDSTLSSRVNAAHRGCRSRVTGNGVRYPFYPNGAMEVRNGFQVGDGRSRPQ